VFVGGQYSGGLKDAEQIDLTRPDGTLADSVNYGGAGWPAVTGQAHSLELTNLTADNNNGANWRLSGSAMGSPGATNN
jgi:hypothetical protein